MLRLLQSRTLQLVITRGVYLVSWFLLLAFLVRQLEARPVENDRLALGFLWLQLSLVILDFGTGEFFTRRIAHGMAPADAVRAGIKARGIIVAGLAVVATPLVSTLYRDPASRWVIGIALVAAAVRSLNEFAESVLVALGETTQVFRFALAQGAATLLGGWAAVTWGGPSPVPVVFGLLTGVYLILGTLRFRSLVGPASADRLPVGEVLKGCLPFAGMSIAAALTVAAPGLLLSVWPSPVRDLKSFNGASRLWVAALALAQGVFSRLYPEFCRLGPRRDPSLPGLVAHHVHLLNLGGGLAAVVVALFPDWIVRTCYGGALPRCEPMLLLMFGILPMTISALVPGAWLPAGHAERIKTVLVASLTVATWTLLPLLGRERPDLVLVAVFGAAWLAQSMLMWGIAARRALPTPGVVGVLLIPCLSVIACWSRLWAPHGASLAVSIVLLISLLLPLRAILASRRSPIPHTPPPSPKPC